MNLGIIFKSITNAISKNSGHIMTGLVVAGIGATVTCTIKDTLNAADKFDELSEREEVTVVEVVKELGPYYKKTATVALGTAAMAVGADLSWSHQLNSMSAKLALSAAALSKVDDAMVKVVGKDTADKIITEAARPSEKRHTPDGTVITVTDQFTGTQFKTTEIDLLNAEFELNRLMVYKKSVSINDFYRILGIELDPHGDDYGWCSWGELYYGYKFIEFAHCWSTDGKTCRLRYPFAPHSDYTDGMDNRDLPPFNE